MKNTTLALSAALLLSSGLYADDKADIEMLKQQVKELQEMTQTLTDETSDLKTGFNYTVVDSQKSFSGLGAAASKIYYSKSPLSIGGYGEMYYSTTQTQGATAGKSIVDVYRFVPYIGYKFSDNIILNTEIEFEHGGSDDPSLLDSNSTKEGGYVKVEFFYLDFLINENFNVRLGNFLVPMGLINERHEPNLFTTVQRPSTEKYIIPSTWHESGAMAFGNITEDLTYKIALVTANTMGVNGSSWIRGGRNGSYKVENPDFATVAELDYTGINGLFVGVSGYFAPSSTGVDENSETLMYDFHADYKNAGFRAYGVYSQALRSKASTIPANADGAAVKEANGGYINLSYDVLSTMQSQYALPVFLQYESVNPQAKRADGFGFDAVNTTTFGVNFLPHEQVVLKAEYAMADNDYKNSKKSSDTFSLSFGFIF